ncbi:MAG TPA: L-serine ammonia-lyase, iron-sulfur-dependent, subunit alpha [Exilispira sp.]|nr:L-serine ammonia-lyase, iron-sulfur-dependent, subunit alpha [Exilispira sp.]
MTKENLIKLIKHELTRTTGCTDPGVICYAVALGKKYLDKIPDKIELNMSLNIFKNALNVGIPGTGEIGIELAAALGVFSNNSDAKLSILEGVSQEQIQAAKKYRSEGKITVKCIIPDDQKAIISPQDLLYVEANLFSDKDRVKVVIHSDYTNVALIEKNNTIIFKQDSLAENKHPSLCESENKKMENKNVQYKNNSSKDTGYFSLNIDDDFDESSINNLRNSLKKDRFEDIIKSILEIEETSFKFLFDAAKTNFEAAISGLDSKNTRFGKSLSDIGFCSKSDELRPTACCAARSVETYTAAAGEARMLGLPVPIMALTGSGNQGITALVGVYSANRRIDASENVLLQALAISAITTILVKSYLGRLTTICGCAVAASTGVAAGVVHLLGGRTKEMVDAINSVIGTFAGLICDGAKLSCAYKLSATASAATEYAYLAVNGTSIPAGDGIVGYTIDETFTNLAYLNNPGMVETDKKIVDILLKNTESTHRNP